MEKSYKTFVTDLRKLLLAAMDLKEEEIYLNNMEIMKYGTLNQQELKTRPMNKFGGDLQMINYLNMPKRKYHIWQNKMNHSILQC